MATDVKSPGVYIEEIKKLPTSVAQVETAIPAFIGYTETAPTYGQSQSSYPVIERITSMLEFEELFGGPPVENAKVKVDKDYNIESVSMSKARPYQLYRSLQLFFANGGGACYIVAVGVYSSSANVTVDSAKLIAGLDKLETEDEPTLIVVPEAVDLGSSAYQVYQQALFQCKKLQDRFVLIDTHNSTKTAIDDCRQNIGINNLKYGAAYYPWLNTNLSYHFSNDNITFEETATPKVLKENLGALLVKAFTGDGDATLSAILSEPFLQKINNELDKFKSVMPPSGAIAGVYASSDRDRGVWKAPANISINAVSGPAVKITNSDQDSMNIDVNAGKSINAIRSFFGKGTLVWGARTLAGNDNEWRYVNVRRFFNMVEESIKKSISWVVFEPNDPNTWVRVEGMIENYLTGLWRQGALVGSKTDQAFFVNVGLGTTMTSQDILEGRMNVDVGLATSRPAEFIILKFSHKLQEA